MEAGQRFSLIGPGRAGRSLAAALVDVGWEQSRIYRRGDDLTDAATDVDVCVIAVPDRSISSVARGVGPGDAVVVHLSGATPLSALGTEHTAAALHPLQSLADPESGRMALRDAFFAVAGHTIARDIAQQISGKWFEIDDSDRALYHCAAAIASNHTVALLGQVERIATEVGVPLAAFEPLVRASLNNAFSLGPVEALTGPAARGDSATLEAHRAALGARHPNELHAYDALVELAQQLAASTPDDKGHE